MLLKLGYFSDVELGSGNGPCLLSPEGPLARCQRQSPGCFYIPQEGIFGASRGRSGRLLSEVLCSSSGHLVWLLPQMGTGWAHECLLFPDSPLGRPSQGVSLTSRLQHSTWRRKAELGTKGHTAIVTWGSQVPPVMEWAWCL